MLIGTTTNDALTMEPIFDLPADLPPHAPPDLQAVEARVVAEWPVGTFVENVAVLQDGGIVVSVHTANCVERVEPDGRCVTVATLPVPPAGLVARADGGFYVAGGIPGVSPGRVWRVDAGGRAEVAVEVPDALFLNGLTPFDETRLLAADSIRGCLYRLDPATGAVETWFQHELLGKVTTFAFMPGANGLKLFGGYVYVTNTDRALVLRIPIGPDGQPGKPEVVAERLRGDDLAFDTAGNAYLATHVENSVVRLTPAGDRLAIAGPDEGMPGSTAVAFGRGGADRTSLYVTTTGGLLKPYGNVVQTAKLVRLEVGVAGAAIPFAV